MAVDTTAAITVHRPRDDVAAYLWDPANDREWIGGCAAPGWSPRRR
jgi:hypothetical protein